MYAVIIGHSDFALELAKQILSKGHNKVVLVVRNQEQAVETSNELNTIVVKADATETEALDELKLKDCDVFVAATESEKANVLSALYAKEAGAKKIFVKIDNKEAEKILKKLGLIPINAEHFAARAVELMITRPAVSDLVNIGIGEFDIIEHPAKGTKIVGKELGNAKGKNYTALATCKNGNYDFSKQRKITTEDTLILIVSSGKEKNAEKELH